MLRTIANSIVDLARLLCARAFADLSLLLELLLERNNFYVRDNPLVVIRWRSARVSTKIPTTRSKGYTLDGDDNGTFSDDVQISLPGSDARLLRRSTDSTWARSASRISIFYFVSPAETSRQEHRPDLSGAASRVKLNPIPRIAAGVSD